GHGQKRTSRVRCWMSANRGRIGSCAPDFKPLRLTPPKSLLGRLVLDHGVSGRNERMQIKRWKRFGLLASVVWLIVGGLLLSWNETWIAAWRLYCFFSADPACVGTTVFLVAHW